MSQNESKSLPGFFYCPSDADGLIKLSVEERATVMTNQGNYAVSMVDRSDENQMCDLRCALDNSRIPTHRKPDVAIPGHGDVPFDLEC